MKGLKKILLTAGLIGLGTFALGQNLNGKDYVRRVHNFKTEDEAVISEVREYGRQEFTPNPAYPGEIENYIDSLNNLNLFYRTNESTLSDMDRGDVSDYFYNVVNPMGKEEKVKSIEVNGYADCVGKPFDNSVLSEKRARGVSTSLNRSFGGSVPIYVTSFGESLATGEANPKDRKVTVKLNADPIQNALQLMPAKVYNNDQSGSMNQLNAWSSVQSYKFPEGSHVYTFSADNGTKEHDFDLMNEEPWGKTCVYDSLDELLDHYSNTTITTTVNGRDNISRALPYEIIKEAKEKNVKLNFIGINLDKETMKEYTYVSSQTGGKRYFIKKLK